MDIPRVLRVLPDDDAHRLVAASRVATFARGALIVREGDVADSLHVILEGRAAVRLTTRSGERALVTVLGPDSHFGEVSLLGLSQPRRTADVLALERVRTMAVPAAVFHASREANPRLERLVTTILARRVEELSDQLIEAMYDPLEMRVVRRLGDLAALYRTSRTEVVIPLTQAELAQLAGGARPSVNQVLQLLVAEGLVTLGRGRIVITDPDALSRRLWR